MQRLKNFEDLSQCIGILEIKWPIPLILKHNFFQLKHKGVRNFELKNHLEMYFDKRAMLFWKTLLEL